MNYSVINNWNSIPNIEYRFKNDTTDTGFLNETDFKAFVINAGDNGVIQVKNNNPFWVVFDAEIDAYNTNGNRNNSHTTWSQDLFTNPVYFPGESGYDGTVYGGKFASILCPPNSTFTLLNHIFRSLQEDGGQSCEPFSNLNKNERVYAKGEIVDGLQYYGCQPFVQVMTLPKGAMPHVHSVGTLKECNVIDPNGIVPTDKSGYSYVTITDDAGVLQMITQCNSNTPNVDGNYIAFGDCIAPVSPVGPVNPVSPPVATTYYELLSCDKGETVYTTIIPTGKWQRFILAGDPNKYYVSTGVTITSDTDPVGYNNLITATQSTGCILPPIDCKGTISTVCGTVNYTDCNGNKVIETLEKGQYRCVDANSDHIGLEINGECVPPDPCPIQPILDIVEITSMESCLKTLSGTAYKADRLTPVADGTVIFIYEYDEANDLLLPQPNPIPVITCVAINGNWKIKFEGFYKLKKYVAYSLEPIID